MVEDRVPDPELEPVPEPELELLFEFELESELELPVEFEFRGLVVGGPVATALLRPPSELGRVVVVDSSSDPDEFDPDELDPEDVDPDESVPDVPFSDDDSSPGSVVVDAAVRRIAL